MSAQPITREHAHQMNIAEQQQNTRADKEPALPPKPCDQREGYSTGVRREELTRNFAQRRVNRLEECG